MSELAPDRSAIDALRADFHVRLAAAGTDAAVKALADEFLSRKSGSVTGLMKTLGTLVPEARREFGALVNTLKQEIETAVEERRQTLAAARPPAGAVDVTLPSRVRPVGHVHPLMLVRQQIEDIFSHQGYEILEGPEVEDDFHNFEALNMPPDHPARDMQDTFYLESGPLLRTHTSNVQIRAMTGRTPPFRFVAVGRVYRHDLSPRHSPMFNQIEGFLVDERVSFADLKGVLVAFGRHLFGEDAELRFRANHFPFTEPSAELDYSCELCKKQGCRMCSETGWVEWGGCGMIHPRVLERCGIDPQRYQGFAFGMGIDRTASRRYGIPHLRHLFEGDVRVLEQV